MSNSIFYFLIILVNSPLIAYLRWLRGEAKRLDLYIFTNSIT